LRRDLVYLEREFPAALEEIMAKLRHIALSVPDPEATAAFYAKAFGLKRVGTVDHEHVSGVYLSDGVVNLAILKYKTNHLAGDDRGPDYVGIHHLGFWVDEIHAARTAAEAAGATYFAGELPDAEDSFYEVKYRDPNGIVFDLTGNGWIGASKDVVPAASTPQRKETEKV
jgi:catechol 2,3-dioxygenase-like lactoylglutathione lyase family enzyme